MFLFVCLFVCLFDFLLKAETFTKNVQRYLQESLIRSSTLLFQMCLFFSFPIMLQRLQSLFCNHTLYLFLFLTTVCIFVFFKKKECSFIGAVGEQKLYRLVGMQIVTFASLQMPSKPLICPFWFTVPQVVIAVRNSILV